MIMKSTLKDHPATLGPVAESLGRGSHMPERKNLEFVEFTSPWECQPGKVRVMASDGGATRDALSKRAWRNELAQPYIFDSVFERRLHFTNDATQSAMLLSDPDALIAQYTRKMMAFLLFNPNPAHILMIGLGGGSLAKFCYRHLPRSRISVVEIDKDVIALREEFCIPADDDRFRVVHDDGASYIERLDEPIDVLLVDAFDAEGIALSLPQSDFYACAAHRLTKNGVLVMNLWGPRERYVDNLREARAAFGDSLLLVPVSGDANVLLFAFKQPPPQSITDELETLAVRLQMRLLLDFPRYLQRICQGHRLASASAVLCMPVPEIDGE